MSRAAATAAVFRAVADPTRRRLLDLLKRGERPVTSLADTFDVSLPAISQHLKVLKTVGLVRERRDGRRRLYRLRARPLRAVADWVSHYETFWTERLDALDEHLRRTP